MTGLGWTTHAKTTHPKHLEYARLTLMVYAPCSGRSGIESIERLVDDNFGGCWARAFRCFCLDPTAHWCPIWVRRNYEVQNEVQCGFPNEDLVLPKSDAKGDEDAKERRIFPHSSAKPSFVFQSADKPRDEEDSEDEHLEARKLDDKWQNEARPAWERHSEQGPNRNCVGTTIRREILDDVVNPSGHNYETTHVKITLPEWNQQWDILKKSSSQYTDSTKRKSNLDDDYQRLFVNMLLKHRDADQALQSQNPARRTCSSHLPPRYSWHGQENQRSDFSTRDYFAP